MEYSPISIAIFSAIAIIASFCLASFTPQIHFQSDWSYYKCKNIDKENCPKKIHEWVLNFLGSAIGWVALAYFIAHFKASLFTLTWTDIFLLLVSFYGITGYLPHMLINKLGSLLDMIPSGKNP